MTPEKLGGLLTRLRNSQEELAQHIRKKHNGITPTTCHECNNIKYEIMWNKELIEELKSLKSSTS